MSDKVLVVAKEKAAERKFTNVFRRGQTATTMEAR